MYFISEYDFYIISNFVMSLLYSFLFEFILFVVLIYEFYGWG